MPAAYAHYRFGKDVLDCLPSLYKKPIKKYRELYDIGLHGPDILFYYKPLSSNPINKTGNAMHDQPADTFFLRMSDIFKTCEAPEALTAYLYGFICHFALDSTCHPYIEKITSANHISHTELETELERYYMLKDNIDPMAYVPIQHIYTTDFNCKVIAPCFGLTEKEIKASLKGMITSHKLLHAPTKFKRTVLYTGLKLTGNYDYMQGLIMKPNADLTCEKYFTLLNNLYEEAITVATSLIQQYTNVLEHNTGISPRFHLTFGAGENWEQLYII